MKVWEKIDKVLTGFSGYLTGMLLLASTLVLFVNVFLRYIFHSSTTWAEEAIRYAIIWVTFVGAAVCARRGSHVGIDLFAQALPALGMKIVLAFGQFISAVFMAFCTFYGWEMFLLMLSTGQKSPAMMMPMAVVYFAMPLGFLLTTIQFIAAGVRILKTPDSEIKHEQTAEEIDITRLN